MNIITALRMAYEILSWGRDLASLVRDIGRALHADDTERAADLVATRKREQAAGRAAHEASKNVRKL